MFRALLLVTALIVYGCLYPFHFHAFPADGWDRFWHTWPAALDRGTVRDILINLLLYLPFGLFSFLSLDRVRHVPLRTVLPIFLAVFLSTTVEVLQLTDYTRTSSVFDVVCNLSGAAIGIVAARLYSDPLRRLATDTRTSFSHTPTPPVALFYLWLAYQLFPLFPSIGLFAMRAKVTTLLSHPPEIFETFLAFAEWFSIGYLCRYLFAGDAWRPWLPLYLLLLPARLFLLGRNLTLSEPIGAVLAYILCRRLLRRPPLPLVLSTLLLAALVVMELLPFHFTAIASSFSWTPFAGFIETGPDWGAVVFLKKSFWYGTAVWAVSNTGAGYFRSAAGVALLLGVLEAAQRYIRGRTPEISDPVLALIMALLLYLLQQSAESSKPASPCMPE